MFLRRAQVYWVTWALLVLGAWSTGMASTQDAFFRGAIAAFLSAAALPLYGQLGPRRAAFLGLVVGVVWQLGLHHAWERWTWDEERFALAQARMVLDLSVAAAAFAGGALTGALLESGSGLPKAVGLGALLALAMTALPYGALNAYDRRRAGPIDVLWLAPATLDEEGRPVRPKGSVTPRLTAAEIALLRERFLTVAAGDETAAVDPEGRRLWPAWRARLVQPGHVAAAARTIVLVNRLPAETAVPALTLPLTDDPKGLAGVELALVDGRPVAVAFGDPVDANPSVRLSLGQNAEGVFVRAGRDLPIVGTFPEAPSDQAVGRPVGIPPPAASPASPAGERPLPPSLRSPGAPTALPR